MQKSQKKKRRKKKNFYETFFLAFLLFPVIKRAEKVSVFLYFRKGRGKCEINYKKKKIFFLSFRKLFHYFWSLVCRKR